MEASYIQLDREVEKSYGSRLEYGAYLFDGHLKNLVI